MKPSGLFVLGCAAWALIAVGACRINDVECDQECQDGWLDSGLRPDSCASPDNAVCLVSKRIPAPGDSKSAVPVIIAVHGFTASTFEWEEFAAFADTVSGGGGLLVSRVLLGGHGENLEGFQSSAWQDWGRPILAEYDSLRKAGFTNISFACASTGCALLMQYFSNGSFAKRAPPKGVFMVDPIVVPTSKLLSMINVAGPILGNSPNPGSEVENAHWFVNRPQETLAELYELINLVKNRLEDGFRLPEGARAKVYKSKKDRNADPVGALLIYKGMREWDGGRIEVEMADSRLHVLTRLAGRDPIPSPADSALQLRIFREMAGMASR